MTLGLPHNWHVSLAAIVVNESAFLLFRVDSQLEKIVLTLSVGLGRNASLLSRTLRSSAQTLQRSLTNGWLRLFVKKFNVGNTLHMSA